MKLNISQRLMIGAATVVTLALSACATPTADGSTQPPQAAPSVVKVVVHDSFQFSDAQREQFEEESGFKLEILTNGDGGALANKLVLTKDSPLGDVAYGIDNTFASRAVAENVFASYSSPNSLELSQSLALPGSDALTAIDYGDVCLNLDPQWFTDNDVVEPQTLEDLTKPEYKDLTVVTNAATSSPGLSFLFATIGKFGSDGYLDYWADLEANGLKVVDGWEDAYYVDFSGTGEGDRPIALSYASSPAFTLTEDGTETTTSAMLDTCFRQVEYAGVLTNATNPQGGQAFIDYLLTNSFQSTIADAMYMYPASDGVDLPSEWAKFAPVPTDPISLDATEIADNRDAWIKAWNAAVIG